MFQYTNHELAIVIAVPIITIILLWTVVIFHKNKKRWRAYDIAIVAILVLSVLRNISVITFVVLQRIEIPEPYHLDLCSAFVWFFNSIHTFQASCLTTLAIIGLFSIKLHRKQQSLKQYLTGSHVIYHLFCLTTLCACVGVAAILAKQEAVQLVQDFVSLKVKNCKFMPYQLDLKYNAFIIVLHVFLAFISFVAFLYVCAIYWKMKHNGFDYLKKSTSDLSELSLSTVNPNEANKSYYDTYTIHRNGSYGQYDSQAPLNAYNTIWKSDMSNVSTTVSSTNSRRPLSKENSEEENVGTGLETIHPILVVCYLFYHIPIIVLCIFPTLISPLSVATSALWLGLLQDVLIPVSLGLVDTRFNQWVSKVYRCSSTRDVEGKLPHVGLDGKFRPFGSQPQSLEASQMLPDRAPTGRCFPSSEPKFPITNGSLYTSIDGRVPVIHNYRRHNSDNRAKLDNNMLNLGIHSSNLKRQNRPACSNCDKPHCNMSYCSSSDLIRNSVYNLNVGPRNQVLLKPYLRHVSLSQNSLRQIPLGETREYTLSTLSLDQEPKTRSQLRLSKSYDSLNELEKFKQTTQNNSVDSDDDYFTDSVNLETNQNFDTMSTQSSYSITTEANCDFDFYQNDKPDYSKTKPERLTRIGSKTSISNFKIKRSNSKRSLENLQAYVDEEIFHPKSLHKSNSFMSTLERRKPLNVSVEFLHEGNFLDLPSKKSFKQTGRQFYAGSVPDLKKIFISEYI